MQRALMVTACMLPLCLGVRAGAQEGFPRFLLATGDSTPPSVEVPPGGLPTAYRQLVTVRIGRVPRREALRHVATASGLQFVYANSLIASEDTVLLDVTSRSVADVLRDVLWNAGVDIVVSPHANAVLVRRRAATTGVPTRHVVRGVVFDSIAGRPIVGAVVQIAASNSPRTPWTATTDSTGAFRVEGLPAGQYMVGFFHDALLAFGLESSTRGVELAADSVVIADLALPSLEAVVALRCGAKASRPDRGMLFGAVRDATNGVAVPGAVLRVSWGAITVENGQAHVLQEEVLASIEPDGAYLVCGLPLDAPLDLRVSAPGYREIAGPVVTVPLSGARQLDVRLADAAIERGAALLRGHVMNASGRAIASGRIRLHSLGREAAIHDGNFTLRDLPGGTWILETRVIGTEPRATLVTVTDSASNDATITVDNALQRLDAVTVVGKLDRNSRVLEDVLRRRRHYAGTFFLPGSDAVKRASFTSDLLKEARGFTWRSGTRVLARGRGDCVALFVDDAYEPQALDVLDDVAPLKNLLAVETYPTIELAPVQFRFAFGRPDPRNPLARKAACAVIVVWTKRDF